MTVLVWRVPQNYLIPTFVVEYKWIKQNIKIIIIITIIIYTQTLNSSIIYCGIVNGGKCVPTLFRFSPLPLRSLILIFLAVTRHRGVWSCGGRDWWPADCCCSRSLVYLIGHYSIIILSSSISSPFATNYIVGSVTLVLPNLHRAPSP